MANFGKRLRRALEERKMTQGELARRAGLSQGSISDMVERDLPSKHVFALARALSVRAEWLALGEGGMELPDIGQGRVMVPHYDVRVSAGAGAIVTEEAKLGEFTCPIEVLRQFAPGSERFAFVTADGDSMADTIRGGELLLVDVSVEELVGPGVYVVLFRDQTLVKRLRRHDDRLILKSDNAAYRTIELLGPQMNDVKVIGRVRAVLRGIGAEEKP